MMWLSLTYLFADAFHQAINILNLWVLKHQIILQKINARRARTSSKPFIDRTREPMNFTIIVSLGKGCGGREIWHS